MAIVPATRIPSTPGPDSGFVGMGAGFALYLNIPFILLLFGLVIAFPRKEAWNQTRIIGGIVTMSTLFIVGHFLFSSTVSLEVRNQNNKAVAATTIVYIKRSKNVFFPFDGKGYIRTDSVGRASIRCYYFQMLTIGRVQKEGYVDDGGKDKLFYPAKWSYPGGYKSGEYATNYKPIIIKVFKETREKKRLIADRVNFKFEYSSAIIYSNSRGSISTSIPIPGAIDDIKISIKSESSKIEPGLLENWAYLISSTGGIQLAENLTNIAPEAGYTKASGRRFVRGPIYFRISPHGTYYFHTAKGLYGKLSISIRKAQEKQKWRISYRYWINQSGSRMLFHPEQRRYTGVKTDPPINKFNGFVIHSF